MNIGFLIYHAGMFALLVVSFYDNRRLRKKREEDLKEYFDIHHKYIDALHENQRLTERLGEYE